jgi:protein TonB
MEVHYLVDKMSVVEGGMGKLLKDVRMHLKAPAKYPIDTKVIVAFIIDKDGEVTGERIIRDIEGSNYALQLLTAVKNNKWVPGKCNGRNVATLQVLPMIIEFN